MSCSYKLCMKFFIMKWTFSSVTDPGCYVCLLGGNVLYPTRAWATTHGVVKYHRALFTCFNLPDLLPAPSFIARGPDFPTATPSGQATRCLPYIYVGPRPARCLLDKTCKSWRRTPGVSPSQADLFCQLVTSHQRSQTRIRESLMAVRSELRIRSAVKNRPQRMHGFNGLPPPHCQWSIQFLPASVHESSHGSWLLLAGRASVEGCSL